MLLADAVEGSGVELLRHGNFENLGFISDSRAEMLTFVEDEHFMAALHKNRYISAVITKPDFAGKATDRFGLAVCEHPRLAFAHIHNRLCRSSFYWHDFPTAVHPDANVHPSAWIAERNVRIGAGTTIGPRATVLERCEISEGCVIGASCILGGVGFQTVRTENAMVEMQHAGGLLLRARVHVLPGAVIATGLFRQQTDIGSDVRIGSQAFVSHGVQIGPATFVGHGCIINGNTLIRERVWIGPGAVIAQNLAIAERAIVSLGAVVIRDVPADTRVSGNFAEPHRTLLRRMAARA